MQQIRVDAEHPLFVYYPCGVGESPGGTAFGLQQIYGDHVHCFFVEPTNCPTVLTGLLAGEMRHIRKKTSDHTYSNSNVPLSLEVCGGVK